MKLGTLISVAIACGHVTACCGAEPSGPAQVEPEPTLWRATPEQVRAVEATLEGQRVTVTRDEIDPTRAWCRVVTEREGEPPQVIEFPVEGQTAGELFRELAAPAIRETVGEAEQATAGLDGTRTLRVTIDGQPSKLLHVAPSPDDDTQRRVLDPTTGHAYVVGDAWWRTLEAAPRLLPLRKLVERRGLERVTIHARGRAWSLALRDDAWVPDDPGVDRARADAIVRAALALRPGAFDRALDPATLREVVRLELVGGERRQTLALYAGTDDETWWVRSTRAVGLAKVHHLDALALAKQVSALE